MDQRRAYDFYKPPLSSDVIITANETHSQTQQSVENPTQKEKKSKRKNRNQKKKLLKEHQEMMKSINLKIPETQEEIDAWIAERKKKFPTRKRIEAKEQEQQEREDRGALDLSKNATKEIRKDQKRKKHLDGDQPIEMSTRKPKKIPSILDKITEDEERRKRSIVLQCFRYFVLHNFLQEPFNTENNEENNSYYSEYYSDDEQKD